jgi:hypothetical protein
MTKDMYSRGYPSHIEARKQAVSQQMRWKSKLPNLDIL